MSAFSRSTGALASLFAALPALAAPSQKSSLDLTLYQAVLDRYVRADGRVDYSGLRKDPGLLDRFVSQLGEISPDSAPGAFVGKTDKLAYWINAYNALVIRSFSREYPEKRDRLQGVLGRAQFFYNARHRVGGRYRSLAEIEDNSIRAMGDPRIHFVIVCASKSCPWLPRTAFTGHNLESQLEVETRRYWAQARNFRLNEKSGEVWLPVILDWFRADFGKTPAAIQQFVARYRPAERKSLQAGTNRIRYFEYDWSPNDIR